LSNVSSEQTIALVRSTLLGSAPVQALVGNRIAGGWSESPDVGTMTRPCVALVLASGGFAAYEGAWEVVPVEVWGLSDVSAGEARAVYDACFDALQAAGIAGQTHRGLAVETMRPRDGWWEAGAAWFACGRWRVSVVRDQS